MWNPTVAPDVNWAALAWVEILAGGARGTTWHRRNDKIALSDDGKRTRSVAELDDQARAATVAVARVTSVPALVREVLAWRAIAGYPLGFHHEDGDQDECESFNHDTGWCDHVRAYAATAADALLRYNLLNILDTVDEHGEHPRVDLHDLMRSIRAAVRGEIDD
jgi:hypothetical protein